MKITGVKSFAHAAPCADMRGDGRNYVYVKIETDAGVHGWGEASCGSLSVITMIDDLGRELIGRDPFQIERHWQHLYHCHHNIRGGIIHMAALSGCDIALWDIKARALGVPVYELLGGKVRDRLWCYSRFDGPDPVSAAKHARREVSRGFTALKGDPFRQKGPYMTPEATDAAAAIVLAVREAVGPKIELLIEAHGRLTVASACRFLDAVSPSRPLLIEEPLPPEDIDGLEQLRRHSSVMIAAGERILTKWAFRPLLERRLVDIVQPDPAHAGGITELRKIAALAEAHNTWIQPHNPYGPVNTMAAAHLNASLPNFLIMELIMEPGMHDWFGEVSGGAFPEPIDGFFPVPSGPGLGVEIDELALARLPPVPELRPSGYVRHAPLASPHGIDWT